MEDLILDDELSPHDSDPKEVRYAGFWIRVGATLIDTIVMIPFIAFMFYNMLTLKSLPILIVVALITAAYKPFMEYYYGATLGKMATKLKVVDRNMEGITTDQTIMRSSPWLFSSIASLFATVMLFSTDGFSEIEGFMDYSLFAAQSEYSWLTNIAAWPSIIASIVVAFAAKKQGLHDMLAKTFCIYKE